jgi:hypothetical protein
VPWIWEVFNFSRKIFKAARVAVATLKKAHNHALMGGCIKNYNCNLLRMCLQLQLTVAAGYMDMCVYNRRSLLEVHNCVYNLQLLETL